MTSASFSPNWPCQAPGRLPSDAMVRTGSSIREYSTYSDMEGGGQQSAVVGHICRIGGRSCPWSTVGLMDVQHSCGVEHCAYKGAVELCSCRRLGVTDSPLHGHTKDQRQAVARKDKSVQSRHSNHYSAPLSRALVIPNYYTRKTYTTSSARLYSYTYPHKRDFAATDR